MDIPIDHTARYIAKLHEIRDAIAPVTVTPEQGINIILKALQEEHDWVIRLDSRLKAVQDEQTALAAAQGLRVKPIEVWKLNLPQLAVHIPKPPDDDYYGDDDEPDMDFDDDDDDSIQDDPQDQPPFTD